ncbi:MAG: hypothetical protein N2515_11295, partial [Deltaproteobacteria bacterium]|nr:hypothetical protein [Deltaproteobacteria bacterium]
RGLGDVYKRQVEGWSAMGVPVLSSADPSDQARISGLLRAGVSEIVSRPVKVEELLKKLERAIRKQRMRRR